MLVLGRLVDARWTLRHPGKAMMARRLAWMRKYWPLTMMASYFLCHALIYFVGLLWHLPPEIPRNLRDGSDNELLWKWNIPSEIPRILRNAPDLLGGVLFGATFFGVRWTQLGRRRLDGVVVVVVSLVGQGWLIYTDFQTAKSSAFLGEFRPDGDTRISRIPEAAMRSNRGHPGHSGRIAAQFYFRETGVAIPYRDESDEVRMFEPDAKATSAREGELEGRRLLDKSRPMFRAHDVSLRWFGYSKLFLAAAAVFMSMGLFWQRKSRVAIDSSAKLFVPGQ
jgi:hypothetical protein